MRAASIAFAFTIFTSQEANSARWAYVGDSANRLNFIASESVSRGEGGLVSAWFLATNKDSSVVGDIKSVKVLHVFDCKKRMYGVMQAIGYKSIFGTGQPTSPTEYTSNPAMKPIAPGTTGEELLQVACLDTSELEKFASEASSYDDTKPPVRPND